MFGGTRPDGHEYGRMASEGAGPGICAGICAGAIWGRGMHVRIILCLVTAGV